jgi:hypothetical protein
MAKSLKTALILDPINGDNIVILATAGTISLTGKATGAFESGDVVTISVNDTTFTGTVNNLGDYSINVNATDLIADTNKKVDVSIAATVILDGDKQTANAAQYYAVEDCDCVGDETHTALVIDPITDDNIITSDESSGDITITGRVTNKWASGDVVTLVSNGTAFTGNAAIDGTFSIDIPASDLLADGDLQLDGSVTGTGGTLAYGIQIYIKHYTGSILLRRGPSADRLAFVPLDGEIIYDSETKKIFVGDGETYGGVPVISDSIASNSFETIVVSGQTSVIADSGTDTLTYVAGTGISITTNAISDTITFTSTGQVTVSAAVSAAGTNQSSATALTSTINNITTAAASTGVKLPTAVAGTRILVFNNGVNIVSVYPDVGAAINSLASNAAFSLDIGARLEFVAISTTQWYTLNATFA